MEERKFSSKCSTSQKKQFIGSRWIVARFCLSFAIRSHNIALLAATMWICAPRRTAPHQTRQVKRRALGIYAARRYGYFADRR
jgi:hypothetical protein